MENSKIKNQSIDKLLIEINNKENYQILDERNFNDINAFLKYRQILVMMLEDLKLIKLPIKDDETILITKFGDDVINQGGWIKYLENEQNHKITEESRQIKSDQILELDLQLKKFEKKYEKKLIIAGFIITALSFLITILTVQYMQNAENEKSNKKNIEQINNSKYNTNLKYL